MKILIAPFVNVVEEADTIISVHNAIETNKVNLNFLDACKSYRAGQPIAIDSATHSEGVWLMDVVSIDRNTKTIEVANFTFCS